MKRRRGDCGCALVLAGGALAAREGARHRGMRATRSGGKSLGLKGRRYARCKRGCDQWGVARLGEDSHDVEGLGVEWLLRQGQGWEELVKWGDAHTVRKGWPWCGGNKERR